MLRGRRSKLSLALAFICLLSGSAAAQTGTAYTLDDVMEFVKGGLSSSSILGRVRNSCINFKVTESVSDRLRGSGANEALIEGLRDSCYKSDSKSGGDTHDRTPGRDVARTKPIKRDPVPTRKVVVPPRVRPVVTPTIYSPPLTNTVNNGVIDWDFRSSQPLTAGHFNNCQYDYSPAGYTIRVLEYGGSCLDGSNQEWGSNLRVTAQATPVSGSAGYTYGLRFGITDDSTVGYYALEVSSYGHYQLSRYRLNKWEVVLPWQNGSGINASSMNTITADIRGSTVIVTINGITQTTYQAPAPIRGRAGFGIIGFDKDGPFPVVTFASFGVSGEKGAAPVPVTPPVVTANNDVPVLDYDFRTSQPFSSGLFGHCRYEYSSSGYTISVADTAGYICLDGPSGIQPASIRVSATAQPLRAGTGYMYGLRFGHNTEPSVGYYLFELDEQNRIKLSRYVGNWETLVPWQMINGVNSVSSGMPNTMTAEIRGSSVTLFVNGAQVGSYQNSSPITGKVGFGITGFLNGLPAVTFSKFSVSSLATPSVVTPVVSPTASAVDWDFSLQQPLSTGVYGKCRYEYANGGYTVSVDQPGSTCIDGPSGERPASIRVSTSARGLRGGTGYTYGLRLGYTTDQNIGYYAFEISEGGSVQLSRYRNNSWEALIPWQRLSAVNSAASGIPNNMTAEVRGTSIVLYVNGTQVGSYQAPYAPVGPAGFGIIGYDQSLANPAVVFTRFSITPLY